jgi:hypothetical protein
MLTDASEVRAASIIRAMSDDLVAGRKKKRRRRKTRNEVGKRSGKRDEAEEFNT